MNKVNFEQITNNLDFNFLEVEYVGYELFANYIFDNEINKWEEEDGLGYLQNEKEELDKEKFSQYIYDTLEFLEYAKIEHESIGKRGQVEYWLTGLKGSNNQKLGIFSSGKKKFEYTISTNDMIIHLKLSK